MKGAAIEERDTLVSVYEINQSININLIAIMFTPFHLVIGCGERDVSIVSDRTCLMKSILSR